MAPQTRDDLKNVLREVIREEFRSVFGPGFGTASDEPEQRMKDFFFLRTFRQKSESVGSKIVVVFLSFVVAGLAALGMFGKIGQFLGPSK